MEYLECKAFFNYFLSLEKDVFQTETYVAFHEKNYGVFSIEFSKLLVSICCEVETVLKKICYELNPSKRYENIIHYKSCISEQFHYFAIESVYFRSMNKIISPWLAWSENNQLIWWQNYTQVKHNRADDDKEGNPIFFKANLENVLTALAALYIAEEYLFYLCEKKYKYSPSKESYAMLSLISEKLIMKRWERCYLEFMGNKWCDLGVIDALMLKQSDSESEEFQ